MTAYPIKREGKYLHTDTKNGVFWGGKEGASHFFSTDAATQVSCGLTSNRAHITIVVCEGE